MQLRLGSAPMMNAPGMLQWARNGYRFGEDKDVFIEVMMCWDYVTRGIAIDILENNVSVEIEGDTIVVTYEEPGE